MKNNDVAEGLDNIFAEVRKQKQAMLEKVKGQVITYFKQKPDEKTKLIKNLVRDETFRFVPKFVQDVVTTYLDISAITSLENKETDAEQTIDVIGSALKEALLRMDMSDLASGKKSIHKAKAETLASIITNLITLSLLMQHTCKIDTDDIIKDMENHAQSIQGVVGMLKDQSGDIKQKFVNADNELVNFTAEMNLQKMAEDVFNKVKGKAGANNEVQ